ncbi:MAG TPA: hypothetical protein PLU81_05710 [Deltaproteobacteria bacterium]|nr:hypothetical protein [Deltaproteobacteria bacterium]
MNEDKTIIEPEYICHFTHKKCLKDKCPCWGLKIRASHPYKEQNPFEWDCFFGLAVKKIAEELEVNVTN